MSVSNPSTQTYECKVCGGPRTPTTSVRGSFCSTACFDRHKQRKHARDILATIRKDHRFCGTCFRQTKEVEKPPSERWGLPDCVIGFEYRTEHADEGEKTVATDEYGHESLVGFGQTCECGNTQHAQAEPIIRDRFALELAYWLLEAVSELRAEGKVDEDVTVDDAVLFEALIDADTNHEDALAAALSL